MRGWTVEDLAARKVLLGYAWDARGEEVPVYISLRALCSHLMIRADTGGGKGTLQKWLLYALAWAGYGWTSFWPLSKDPWELLAALPAHRRDQVVWAPLNDPDYVLPLNFLARETDSEDELAFLEREALNLYFTLWPDNWSQSMAALLRAATRAAILLRWQPARLAALFLDREVRAEAVEGLQAVPTEANLRAASILARMDKMEGNAVWGPLNRLLEILDDPYLADALNADTCYRFDRAIRQGLHTIVYTAADHLGPLPSRLAAAILVPRAWRAAQAIPPGERTFHLIDLDEAGFAAGRVAGTLKQILEQARQFHFGCVLACQHGRQFPEELQETQAIVGNWVIGRQKGEHAARAAAVMGRGPWAPSDHDYTALADNTYYARLLRPDGRPTRVFSLRAAGFLQPQHDPAELARYSMQRYLVPRRRARATPAPGGRDAEIA